MLTHIQQAWRFKFWVNDRTHKMVQTVMTRYKLSWRDLGTRTSKNVLDKIATYAIGKVRRVLLPKLVKRVTKRVTEDDSLASRLQEHKDKKRNRGGIKNQEFSPHIYVKKEPETSTPTCTTMIEDETSANHSSPVSTITSMSQMISPELEQCVLEHLRKGGTPLTIGNEDEWNIFKKMFERNKDEARVEDTRLDDNVMRLNEVQCTNNELMTEFDKESRNMEEQEIEKDMHGDVEEDEVYEGDLKCDGTCTYEMEFCQHRETLRKRFGGKMKCVGEGCGKTLWEVTKTAQAYVCIKCKHKECRNMLCYDCYGSGGRTRKTRRGLHTTVEAVPV